MKALDDQDLTTDTSASIAEAEARAELTADYLRSVLTRIGYRCPTLEQIANTTTANFAVADRWLNNKTTH